MIPWKNNRVWHFWISWFWHWVGWTFTRFMIPQFFSCSEDHDYDDDDNDNDNDNDNNFTITHTTINNFFSTPQLLLSQQLLQQHIGSQWLRRQSVIFLYSFTHLSILTCTLSLPFLFRTYFHLCSVYTFCFSSCTTTTSVSLFVYFYCSGRLVLAFVSIIFPFLLHVTLFFFFLLYPVLLTCFHIIFDWERERKNERNKMKNCWDEGTLQHRRQTNMCYIYISIYVKLLIDKTFITKIYYMRDEKKKLRFVWKII